MKKMTKAVSILLAAIMVLGMFSIIPVSAGGISYLDEKGETHTVGTYTAVTGETRTLSKGWYAVSEDVEIAGRMEISGTVNLILCDGKTLTAEKGVHVSEGNTLNIYAQSEGTGALTTGNPGDYNAGIGTNNDESAGTITINGGVITAAGTLDGAGIGGGCNCFGGTITINAGEVHATGGRGGAGIGAGEDSHFITIAISGGTVNAAGGKNARASAPEQAAASARLRFPAAP